LILFALGALQGLIGWIMVRSGLNDTRLYVSHIRLAIHFIAALVLLVYCFLLALEFTDLSRVTAPGWLSNLGIAIAAVLLIQLTFGALMAGLKGGVLAPTWPDINGSYLPSLVIEGQWSDLVNHPLGVHFVHRNLAYLLVLLLIWWTLGVSKLKGDSFFNAIRWVPLALVLFQTALGVLTTINSYKAIPQRWGIFEHLALLHQLVAVILLLSVATVIYALKRSRSS
jgi:heme a synthase